jgi:DNA-binding NarL/FixJ family response regulator
MARASTLLEDAHRRHVAAGDFFGVVMSALPLALALYRQGHPDRSAALLEECLSLTAEHNESWCRAWTLTVLAIQIWRRGDRRRAISLARESLLLNRALDDRHNMTLDIEVLAWIAADAGEHERAARLLGAADSVARTVGIAVLHFAIHMKYHDRTTDLLRRAMGETAYRQAFELGRRLSLDQTVAEALGESPAPELGRAADDRTSSPLTRREAEIALLIAQGLSNREIAETLVISPRTAEGHVEHILAKLGFSSRTQVAAWVTDREPAPE